MLLSSIVATIWASKKRRPAIRYVLTSEKVRLIVVGFG